MIRNILISLFLGCFANTSFACGDASQHRLFPLGESEKGFVFMETHMRRTWEKVDKDKDPEIRMPSTIWYATVYITTYDSSFLKTDEQKISEICFSADETEYILALKEAFEGALLYKKEQLITEVKPVDITFANYSTNCSVLKFVADKKNFKMYLKLKTKQKYYPLDLLKDPNSIATRFVPRKEKELTDEMVFREKLYISSVRRYRIGNQILCIANIGIGQFMESYDGKQLPDGKEHAADFPFKTKDDLVFFEPMIHHGSTFDFMMVE